MRCVISSELTLRSWLIHFSVALCYSGYWHEHLIVITEIKIHLHHQHLDELSYRLYRLEFTLSRLNIIQIASLSNGSYKNYVSMSSDYTQLRKWEEAYKSLWKTKFRRRDNKLRDNKTLMVLNDMKIFWYKNRIPLRHGINTGWGQKFITV